MDYGLEELTQISKDVRGQTYGPFEYFEREGVDLAALGPFIKDQMPHVTTIEASLAIGISIGIEIGKRNERKNNADSPAVR